MSFQDGKISEIYCMNSELIINGNEGELLQDKTL